MHNQQNKLFKQGFKKLNNLFIFFGFFFSSSHKDYFATILQANLVKSVVRQKNANTIHLKKLPTKVGNIKVFKKLELIDLEFKQTES